MNGRIVILKPPKKLRKLLHSVGLVWSVALFAPLIFCVASVVPEWLLAIVALAFVVAAALAIWRKYRA